MAARKAGKASRRDALAVCFAAWNRFGDRQFPVSTTPPRYPAILAARDEGWIWLVSPKTAALTSSGIAALEPYGVKHAPAV